jgi:hypothetical protein
MYSGSVVDQQRIGSGPTRAVSLMIRPETANVGCGHGLMSDRLSCISGYGRVRDSGGKGERPVSANESGRWGAVWVVARQVAVPVVALLLGAAAMALLLDSGTVRLPSAGSRAGAPPSPPEKVVVSSPSTTPSVPTHRRPATPATSTAPASVAHATTGAATQAAAGTGTGPQHSAPSAKPPASQQPAPSGTSASPAPLVAPPAVSPGSTEAGTAESPPPARTHHGLALGHEKNHVPPGPAEPSERAKLKPHGPPPKAPGPPTPDHHTPPGQARKEDQSRPDHGHGDNGEGHGRDHGQGHSEGHGQHGPGRGKH